MAVVSERTSAQMADPTENWTSGVINGDWPSQWTLEAISGPALTFKTEVATFSGSDQLGSARGGATDLSLQLLNTANALAVDADQSVKIAVSSNSVWGGLVARYSGAPGNFYGCLVGYGSTTDRLRIFKRVGSTQTTLATAPTTPAQGLANLTNTSTWYNLRFSVTQNGAATDLRAKVWAVGDPEPGWTLEVLGDAEASLQSVSGRVGIAGRGGSTTNKRAYFDDYRAPAFERRWSDPSTWGAAGPPSATNPALVTGTVIIDGDATAKSIEIAAGATLRFDPAADVKLTSLGNVVVNGVLEMRPETPDEDHVLILAGANEQEFVGSGMSVVSTDVGLWVMGSGRLDLEGAPKTAWVWAKDAIPAGEDEILLKTVPAGWRAGDEVAITPTGDVTNVNNPTQFDVRTIDTINGDALTLSSGTTYAHPSAVVSLNPPFTAEVLNLTRNVRIEGRQPQVKYPRTADLTATANLNGQPVVSGQIDRTVPGHGRSHIFIHNDDVNVVHTLKNVAIRYMGPRKHLAAVNQTESFVGRYGLHFHHSKNQGTIVDGVVVRDTDAHAFVPHVADGITFQNCISFMTSDSAYWWDLRVPSEPEDNYISNDIVWDRNVAAGVLTDPNNGASPTGFMLARGTGNQVKNCVSVGVLGVSGSPSGYFWQEHAGGSVWLFENNLSHNSRGFGAFTWQNDGELHEMDGFVAYRHRLGGINHGAYNNRYHWRNATLFNNNGLPGTESDVGQFQLHNNSSPAGMWTSEDFIADSAETSSHIMRLFSVRTAAPYPARFFRWNVRGHTGAAIKVHHEFDYMSPSNQSQPVYGIYELIDWKVGDAGRELQPSDFEVVHMTPWSVIRVQRTDGSAFQILPDESAPSKFKCECIERFYGSGSAPGCPEPPVCGGEP